MSSKDGLTRAIGLMSGTSMDGIDIALIDSDGETRIKTGPRGFVAYEPAFREHLKRALEDAKTIHERQERPGSLGEIERDLTERHAIAVRDFLVANRLTAGEIDVIGFHGQTVLHRPGEALTVQLGDGAALARATGIDVVFDMRANDMVHGGQGAPLIPIYHAALAASLGTPGQAAAFINIGGISNMTGIAPDGTLTACDCGPGNALIDQWVEELAGIPYDSGGAIGSEGRLDDTLLARYLAHPFFTDPAITSLDRNDFVPPSASDIGLHDGARTLARLTAEAIIATLLKRMPARPKHLVIGGGGRLNRVIMADLAELASRFGGAVAAAEAFGFNGDSLEAEAWAYLAIRSLEGLPLTFPGTTGVRRPVSGGVLAKARPQA